MDLFPPITPYRTGFLPVDGIHTLYFEESGNPRGTPVVFLHGGPGVGLFPYYRQLFDPAIWRIIGFDQRGCGQSTPFAEVTANSPAHLVSDIDHLRLHLGIERWHVLGVSWGTTLALAYAAAMPERILSLTLRGIFLMRQQEIDWFLYGIRTMRPDAWANFAALVPHDQHNQLLEYYLNMLMNPDPTVHAEAARRWSQYEDDCCQLQPALPSVFPHDDDRLNLCIARLEAYYFKHHRFTPDDWLLQAADRYRSIPGVIIQGQYDLICPPSNGYALHTAWPEADYILVPNAGHAATDPGNISAMIKATERFKHIR